MKKANTSRWDRRLWFVCSICLGLCVTVTSECPTQAGVTANGSVLTGVWRLQEDTASGSQQGRLTARTNQRQEAIERVTQQLPFRMRGQARDRLLEATKPQPQLTIVDQDGQITLGRADREMTITTDGKPKRFVKKQRNISMSATRRDDAMVVTTQGDSFTQTTNYRVTKDGRRLLLDIEMRIQRLPEPLRYQLSYISQAEKPAGREARAEQPGFAEGVR